MIINFMFWPFQISIDTAMLLGSALWALALYLGLSSFSDWVTLQLNRWFNYAEASFLYDSPEELERTRLARESQNEFLASLLSILPFLGIGALLEYSLEVSLGQSWGISFGIMAGLGAAIYELGRRSSEASE
ncbi:MAG: hypothetical protein AAGD25_24540 [Cyanobacteria bacterium P01_F01_bin.150]